LGKYKVKPTLHTSEIADIVSELEMITQVWLLFKQKNAIRWRKHFLISLFIASGIYFFYPHAMWVWGIVLALSALSLVTFAITRFLMQRKLSKAHAKIATLKRLKQQIIIQHSD
jgi:uncharacterized protein with PQ loop repeat